MSRSKGSEHHNLLQEDDEYLASTPQDEEQVYFDSIIGALEETLMEDKFSKMIDSFAEKYCNQFEEGEENKLVYTSIFTEYQGIIEKYLEQSLSKKIDNFEMDRFLRVLEKVEKERQTNSEIVDEKNDDDWEDIEEGEMSGDVFEMLLSFTNFLEFKELMLSYKKKDYFNDKFSGLLVVSNNL